ncbi:MAG: restriction endonuclease subunit S [Tissierellia bacterium]|nr:restriction endonuclease subunit S [Tissierellia bacterium]
MGERLTPELRFLGFKGEWERQRFGDTGEFYNGLSGKDRSSFIDGNKKYIQYLNIFANTLIDTDFTEYGHVSIDEGENQNRVEYGDILFTQSSETMDEVGMTSVYIGDEEEVYLNSFSFGYRFSKAGQFDPRYMGFMLRSNNIRKKIMREGQGSTRFNLSPNRIKGIIFFAPSLGEQRKIGKFFCRIDERLELQQNRIDTLKEYRKGMMQGIFSQGIRFKDDDGIDYPDWQEKRLGDIAKNSDTRYRDDSSFDELLSVTLNNGVKKQSEIGEVDSSSRDKSNYKVVAKNDIVYNTMRMWQGASGVSEYDGIVSSAYVVLKLAEGIDPEFIGYYFKMPQIIYKFFRGSQGMTSDTLTLKYNLFKDIVIDIPSLPEQNKIVDFLPSLDKRIELEERKLEEFNLIKKELMRRMFI